LTTHLNLLCSFRICYLLKTLHPSAHIWFWGEVRREKFSDWYDLKAALYKEFKSSTSDFDIMRQIFERYQRSNESVDDYFFAIWQLRSKLRQPIAEKEIIKMVKRNLNENLAGIVFAVPATTLEQLREECKDAEKALLKRNFKPSAIRKDRSDRVNAIFNEDEDTIYYNSNESPVVSEVTNSNSRESNKCQLICWNCRLHGHVYRERESNERKIFCYKCGREGVITPKCPVCSENLKRAANKTGVQRVPLTEKN